MVITEYLERNARLWGNDIALVEVNPSEERDAATTWREASLVAEARPDAPYRRELSWRDFDRRANRFANLLLSRGTKRGTKVAMLLMNCHRAGCRSISAFSRPGAVVVPDELSATPADEIRYCLDLADVDVPHLSVRHLSDVWMPSAGQTPGVQDNASLSAARDGARTTTRSPDVHSIAH